MKEKLDRTIDLLVKIKVRYERGNVYMKYVRDYILIYASFTLIGISGLVIIPLAFIPLLLGHFDIWIGFLQRENRYYAEVLTGFKKKLFKEKKK